MKGMDEVGRLFNANEMIVAEVLQSAEAMKAAVSHLERFMEKSDTRSRGKLLLATVKGDVHDIGKNLVDIIVSNNGYEVVNLGIKVPPEELIEAAQRHRPDAIGLSGLLVKSAQQMAITADDLRDAGVDAPLLVGGAALSDKFTRTRIAPRYDATVVYCKDAMNGLDTLNRLMDPDARRELEATLAEHRDVGDVAAPAAEAAAEPEVRSSRVRVDIEIPPVPDLDRHVEEARDLDEIWSYINPQMLYGRHMGFRGRFSEALAAGDVKAVDLEKKIEAVKQECRDGAMHVRAVWQFFEAESDGNELRLFERGETAPVTTFRFPRQRRPDGLSIPDFVLPSARRRARSRRAARDDGRRGHRRAGGAREGGGRVRALVRAAGARAGERRGRGRVAARAAARGVGLRRRPVAAAQGAVPGAVSRQALLVRLSGVPGPRAAGQALPAAAPGGDRRQPHRRLHDGAGGQRLGARLPPPGRGVLQRGGGGRGGVKVTRPNRKAARRGGSIAPRPANASSAIQRKIDMIIKRRASALGMLD